MRASVPSASLPDIGDASRSFVKIAPGSPTRGDAFGRPRRDDVIVNGPYEAQLVFEKS